jgi:hypothetical protein
MMYKEREKKWWHIFFTNKSKTDNACQASVEENWHKAFTSQTKKVVLNCKDTKSDGFLEWGSVDQISLDQKCVLALDQKFFFNRLKVSNNDLI